MTAAGYPITMAGDLPVVTAPEEITESDADQLRIALLQAAGRGAGTMVLDLTRTRRCAPAAVRVLARAQLWALSDHGELRLAGLSTSVRADLAGLGPGQRVPCYASVAQAVASPPAEARTARWRARRPRGARGAGPHSSPAAAASQPLARLAGLALGTAGSGPATAPQPPSRSARSVALARSCSPGPAERP